MGEGSADLGRRAQEILADALDLPEHERDAWVEGACADDAELLEEVRSLLRASREASGFFRNLADRVAGAADEELERGGLTGRVFGHFEVGDNLGRGGMGDVYRAFDTRLARDVALKVLPPHLAEDPKHVARFRQEARIVASLRHPNIATIHEVEEIDGRIFLVLELVEGPTLRDRLALGPLSVRETLDIARQIAEALEAAHDAGVVHRDLKPANVKIDPEGKVRVLDFGIAKPLERQRRPGSYLNTSPTTPVDVTTPGMVLGTATYMSPEQARGKPIDQRSDVWAFGALLYEMLAGRRAFEGEDLTEVVARILESTPDWDAVPRDTPAPVVGLLRRCLERNVRRRLQAIGEARIVLEDALADGPPPAPSDTGRHPGRWTVAGMAAAAGLVVGLLAAGLLRSGPSADVTPRTLRLAVAEDAAEPLLAPTGDRVVFVGDDVAWVVFFDGSAPRRLDGSEGGYALFWSPDGQHVGFVRDGAIWRISADGGQPSVVGTLDERGFAAAGWLPDGDVVAAVNGGLVAYPELGGASRQVWQAPPEERSAPRGLEPGPDGGLFLIRDSRKISLWRGGEMHDVYTTAQGALVDLAYAAPDHLVFRRRLADPGLWALPVSRSGAPAGAPFLVSTTDERPSASRHGDLAYFDRRTSRQRRNLIWIDRSGEALSVIGTPQSRLEHIDMSPSGRRIVGVAEEEGRRRTWIHDLATGERFALSPMPDPGQRWPTWAPEEDRIAFRFDKDGAQWIGLKSLEPGVAPVDLGPGVYPAFAPDGKLLFGFGGDIYRLDPEAPTERELFLQTDRGENEPRPSANGLVAFTGQTPTGSAVFVTRYDRPGDRWQVSEDGGYRPRWRSDGRELFYLSGESVMGVSVEFDGNAPSIGRPRTLFTPLPSGPWGLNYAPHPDGQRFVMLRALPRVNIEDVDAIVLIQNWASYFAGR